MSGRTDRPEKPDANRDASTARKRMRRGLRAVRREGRKAALIHATVDAVLVLLVVNLVLRTVELPAVPPSLPVPTALVDAGAPATLDIAVAGGVVAGLVAFALELAVRLRRPLVERFESVNPEVSEALRTARDAVESGREGRMADRLYADTVDRLGETSSLGLIDVRRLAAAVLVVALLAPASVHVAAVGYGVTLDFDGEEPPPAGGTAEEREYAGLQNPDQVLGEPEDVGAGDRDLNTTLPTQGSGNGTASPESYDSGGYAGGAVDVESQQAGFAEEERLEDAELIREYNLRIREEDEDDQ